MKINDQHPTPARGAGQAAGPKGPARAGDGQRAGAREASPLNVPAARIDLSARGRELHAALQAVRAAPEVRADVVAGVRARLAAGNYRVDPEQIARRILDTTA